ncbi:MAG: hypothetical protein H6698_05645 [Myxococcales bacterium]|nr:hypothetical protein [Myxococcales bacterium]MCB9533787.1 hypothetical protein [Myxococcales bacterium]
MRLGLVLVPCALVGLACGAPNGVRASPSDDATDALDGSAQGEVGDPTDAPDTETPDTETPDTETPDTETPDTETPDTETPDTETPDTETPDTETPDTETPDTDAPDSTDAGPSCDYLDLELVIVRCGEAFRYVRTFTDLGGSVDCPAYVRVGGSDVAYPDVDAALAGEGCDASCQWVASTSVTWLRCGHRSGYIVFQADGCGPLYEMPEGLFTSIEAYDQAYPCPD